MLGLETLFDCHDGARKSRKSGCCDCAAEALKLRTAATGAHAFCTLCGDGSALRHLLDTFMVMIGVGGRGCCGVS